MRQRNASFLAATATATGWLGVAALTVLLLVREVAPYPRWDLLACLGVVGAASLWWLRQVHERGVGPSGGAFGSAARPVKGWWPMRRSALTGAAMMLLAAPLVLLLVSAESSTPTLAEIRDGTPTAGRAEVREVHDVRKYSGRSGNSYTSEVTVALRGGGAAGGGERQPYRATVQAFESAERGDLVWALHDEDDPGAGAVLDTDADELRALLGESVSPLSLLGAGGLVLCAAAVALFAFRASRPERLAKPFTEHDGGVCVLRTDGGFEGTAGRYLRYNPRAAGDLSTSEISPALRLRTHEGHRDLFVDRSLDPGALSADVGGTPGRLYLRAGGGASSGSGGAVPALLVLDDGRYVYGRTAPPEPSVGEPEPFSPPVGLRAVGPYAIWAGRAFRPLVAGLGMAFAVAVLMAAGAGSGAGYAEALGRPLVAVAALSPLAGLMLTARRVTVGLRALQARTHGAEPADPEADAAGKAE